ncbi:MAG: addiction module antidote protein, HigA family, partial [Alphaproteobacteria bacterium]|nr:addiction module antidote protein, HigA family [Alphaproteobacteria bacterium]
MMKNPPHPGEHIAEDYLVPLELSVTKAAAALGVTRKALSELVNGHAGISADMAIRLSRVFGTPAQFWVQLQSNYDLWQATERMKRWKPSETFYA